jgi:hypothetical protein
VRDLNDRAHEHIPVEEGAPGPHDQ